MEQARVEQQRIVTRDRLKKQQQEEQRRYINEYRELKRRTDSLLLGSGGVNKFGGGQYDNQNAMFYERHQNFGFPITTTTNAGAVITTVTGNGLNSSLNAHPGDALSRLQADVRSGQVQLDDTEFKGSSAGGKNMVTPEGYENEFDNKDSLDLVGGKRASMPIKGSQ